MDPSAPVVTLVSRGADRVLHGLLRGARDVVGLGAPSACAGCGLPGASVCAGCSALLAGPPRPHRPSPAPPGWPAAFVVTEYAGTTRSLIAAWKERGRRDVAHHLALALAGAIEAALGCDDRCAAIVPIPASAAARRRRGEDAWGRVAKLAVRGMARRGRCIRVEPVLRLTRQPRDQSALSSRERRENVREALACTRVPEGAIVIVDDIVTTGATIAEAARALSVAGADPVSVAAIAATFRSGG